MNNFCVIELWTFKFLTLLEAMVTQISVASSSPNFHAGKSGFFKKKLQCLLLSFRCWGFRDRVLLSGQLLTYLIGKSQLKE